MRARSCAGAASPTAASGASGPTVPHALAAPFAPMKDGIQYAYMRTTVLPAIPRSGGNRLGIVTGRRETTRGRNPNG